MTVGTLLRHPADPQAACGQALPLVKVPPACQDAQHIVFPHPFAPMIPVRKPGSR